MVGREEITEHQIQAEFFKWVREMQLVDERFHLIFAVPNAAKWGRVSGAIKLMSYMKAEGLTKGVSDVIGLIPTKVHHGFVIEFKKPGGIVSPEQFFWLTLAKQVGLAVQVCYSALEGIAFVQFYLSTVAVADNLEDLDMPCKGKKGKKKPVKK